MPASRWPTTACITSRWQVTAGWSASSATVTYTGHDLPDAPVEQVMTPASTTVYEYDPIREAARLMLTNRVSSLPVINYAKELVGLLTTTDCLLAMMEMDTDEE